jgi:hypothetical protein
VGCRCLVGLLVLYNKQLMCQIQSSLLFGNRSNKLTVSTYTAHKQIDLCRRYSPFFHSGVIRGCH